MRWMALGLLIATALDPEARASDEFALRALPSVVWTDTVYRAVGEAPIKAVEADLSTALVAAVEQAFPEPFARGKIRESEALSRSLGSVLHVGLRVSRIQPTMTHFGTDKTTASIYLTSTVFVTNIQTGDILASRSLTCIQPKDYTGYIESMKPADLAPALQSAASLCINALVPDLAANFTPGRTDAHVVGKHDGKLVIDRGYLVGAYAGETFLLADDPTKRVNVIEVQESLSLATTTAKGVDTGDRITRFGVQVDAGAAPRMMAMPGDPSRFPAPGVSESEIAQFASDGLAAAGFVMIPHTDAMFIAKDLESGMLNVSRAEIVGAQATPDILVLSDVARFTVTERADDATGVTDYALSARVVVSFVDMTSGLVLYGATHVEEAVARTREAGRAFDPNSRFPGLVKDAFLAVANAAAGEFKPQRAYGEVQGLPDAQRRVGLKTGTVPLGIGTIGEILAKGPQFRDRDGNSLGFVESVIGSIRVVDSDPKGGKERGQIMSSAVPTIAPGMRVRALPGTSVNDARVLTLGNLILDGGQWVPEAQMARQLKSALYVSPGFRAALTADDKRRLDAVFSHLSGGSFARMTSEMQEPAATHAIDFTVGIAVEDLVKESVNKRKGWVDVSRVIRGSSEIMVRDLDFGTVEQLVHPKTGIVYDSGYRYENGMRLQGREVAGIMPAGITDNEIPDTVSGFVYDVGAELVRRARLMLDAAAARK